MDWRLMAPPAWPGAGFVLSGGLDPFDFAGAAGLLPRPCHCPPGRFLCSGRCRSQPLGRHLQSLGPKQPLDRRAGGFVRVPQRADLVGREVLGGEDPLPLGAQRRPADHLDKLALGIGQGKILLSRHIVRRGPGFAL